MAKRDRARAATCYDPVGERYQSLATFAAEATVRPRAFADVAIRVGDLTP